MLFPPASPLCYPHFRFRPEKAAEAIDLIARARPGLTQYFVGKFLYFADKAHFLDWGRPITFDRYVAMKDGPVPSAVRNMLMAAAGASAGLGEEHVETAKPHADELARHVRVELVVQPSGERQHVYPLAAPPETRHLSGSDIECLEAVIAEMGDRNFSTLRRMSHEDEAWSEAWSRAMGRVAPIDVCLWAQPADRDAFRRQILEHGAAA